LTVIKQTLAEHMLNERVIIQMPNRI